jgi:predicted RND superfamily exporter protein
MVWGVVGSIGACAILSWIVLAAGTANWILATFAVFTIMSIITQVMGTLVWFNNPIYTLGPGSLGIIETIGLSIAVGMSVDYTVHIVNAYNNCPRSDRVSRIRYSMTLMGISITLGMIATNIAAAFLLLCVITFFTGFGTFIVMTIFYSWLSAFFILCPLLMLFGPEGSAGEIVFLKRMMGVGPGSAHLVNNGDIKPPSNREVGAAPSPTDEKLPDDEAEI